MKFAEFISIVDEKKKANPFWFDDVFDSQVEENQILDVENHLGVKLPEKYKEFIKAFGGGYFAFTNVFSADKNGEWFVIDKNNEAKNYLPDNFVAISDDETGGMYGYVIHEGACGEEIFYWDHDSNSISTKMYDDLFEYIIAVGLTI